MLWTFCGLHSPKTPKLLTWETEGELLCSTCKPKNSRAFLPDSTMVTEIYTSQEMEATMEEGLGLLKGVVAIRPPRLEDVGLDDCALSPEAIREAFFKAAGPIKSRVIPDGDNEEEEEGDGGGGVDPGLSNGELPDTLMGTGEIPTKPFYGGGCEKGREDPGKGDDVVVVAGPARRRGSAAPTRSVF